MSRTDPDLPPGGPADALDASGAAFLMSRRRAVGTLLAGGTVIGAGAAAAPPGPAAPTGPTVNAADFGVVADGVTDDAPALRAAIASLRDGAVLELPHGTLALGSPGWQGILISGLEGIHVRGHGTTLRWAAAPTQSRTVFGPSGLLLLDCRRATVSDLTIDGNAMDCIGLTLDGCSHAVVQRVEAFGHGRAASRSGLAQFATARGRHNTWNSCVARDSTHGSECRGFYLGNANAGCGESDLRIEGCVARNNAATGFAIEAVRATCTGCASEDNAGAGFTSSSARASPSVDHLFLGNVARRNAFHGWQSDVYGPRVERIGLTANLFADNRFSGVYCHEATTLSMVGNVVVGNGSERGSPAVSISMSDGVTLSGNHIESDDPRSACIDFSFVGNDVRNVVIANNVCRATAPRIINIEGTDGGCRLRRIVVSGNVLCGGRYGVHLGTTAAGAVVDTVVVANNVADDAHAATLSFADHDVGQSTNVRLTDNCGPGPSLNEAAVLAGNSGNSWNAQRGEGVAPPTRGRWNQGAVFFNSAPGAGAPLGWVCTQSGAPGVWREFARVG